MIPAIVIRFAADFAADAMIAERYRNHDVAVVSAGFSILPLFCVLFSIAVNPRP